MSGPLKPPFGKMAPEGSIRTTADEGEMRTVGVLRFGDVKLYPAREYGLMTWGATHDEEDHFVASFVMAGPNNRRIYKNFSPEMLRDLSAHMLVVADKLEANAARLAAEALTRAGKGGA